MRKPKRLTIIGDNSKEYMFLVKGGEDLRHDQRIEQVELYYWYLIVLYAESVNWEICISSFRLNDILISRAWHKFIQSRP